MLFLECLPLGPVTDDNPTSGQSWNRHWTLEVDRISHQSLAVGNGSLPPCQIAPLVVPPTLSSQKAPVYKVPVLPVQHQVLNQFEIPLVESEEDPESPQEIPQETFELWVRPQVASSLTCLQPPS
nr:hypothetical protein [Tanacetum cinerariifolium]